MWFPYIVWFLGVCTTVVTSEKSCYWNSKCSEQLFATRTPYDEIRGDIRDWPLVNGCEAVSLWALIRHGNRNPGDSLTINMQELQARIKNDIVERFDYEMGTSQLCAQDIYDLRKWEWNSTMETSASYLTGTGYEEIYDMAVRLVHKYPQLFIVPFNGYIRPTNLQRTITSAIAFAHGITDQAQISNVMIDEPRVNDNVLRPYDNCEPYQREVKDGEDLSDQLDAFYKTSEYLQVQKSVTERLGISQELSVDDIFTLYELCRFYRTWSPDKKTPWCAAFSSEDLVVLEYRDDVRHYYRNSYGSPINSQIAGPILKDLYENILSARNGEGKSLVTYFAHDTLFGMVYSALGMYKDRDTITSQRRDPNRLWRTSYVSPFSTNIMVFLNKCGDEYKVQIFNNEKPTTLCPLEGCTWDQFVNIFQNFSDANLDFCNKESINITGDAPGLRALTSIILLTFTIIII